MSNGAAIAIEAEAAPVPMSPGRRALRRLMKRKGAVIGLAVVVLMIALAVFAPLVAPYDPIATDWGAVRKAPSALHWFGTDENGRDVLSRVIWGAQTAILVIVVAILASIVIGVLLGLVSGYFGGWADRLLVVVADAVAVDDRK